MSQTEPSVFEVIDLMTGYQQAALLHAAASVGVFDALASSSSSAAALASQLGTDEPTTLALLDSLVGLGLLTVDDGRYADTAVAKRLASDGDLRLIAEKEWFFYGLWQHLEAAVRTGKPQTPPWAERLTWPQARAFSKALVVLARETGPDLATLPGVGPGSRVLDMGGGLGAYAAPLAAAGASVTLADLPQVVEWARQEIADLTGISLLPVDLLSAEAASVVGSGYDIVLVSHLLHEVDDDSAAALVSLARDVVKPGGTVAIFELPGDPGGPLPAFGPMFDLMMRVETGSRARRFAELEALLTAAGLSDVRRGDFQLPHGVVLGTK